MSVAINLIKLQDYNLRNILLSTIFFFKILESNGTTKNVYDINMPGFLSRSGEAHG